MAAEALALDIDFIGEIKPTAKAVRPRLRSVPPAQTEEARWVAELSAMPARMIGDLPVPVTLRLRSPDGALFSARPGWSSVEGGQGVILDRDEWAALVLATEADRLWPADLVHVLRARGAGGRLSQEALLDGVGFEQAAADLSETGPTLGRVLQRMGARLERVSFVADDDGGAA
jgi:hypothetical protein